MLLGLVIPHKRLVLMVQQLAYNHMLGRNLRLVYLVMHRTLKVFQLVRTLRQQPMALCNQVVMVTQLLRMQLALVNPEHQELHLLQLGFQTTLLLMVLLVRKVCLLGSLREQHLRGPLLLVRHLQMLVALSHLLSVVMFQPSSKHRLHQANSLYQPQQVSLLILALIFLQRETASTVCVFFVNQQLTLLQKLC